MSIGTGDKPGLAPWFGRHGKAPPLPAAMVPRPGAAIPCPEDIHASALGQAVSGAPLPGERPRSALMANPYGGGKCIHFSMQIAQDVLPPLPALRPLVERRA